MKKHIKQRAKTGSLALSIAPLALTGITAIIGLVLSSSVVSATNDSVVDQVNITVPVSCTMTGTGMDSHSTEIENGLYKNNIGTTTLHAFCNDNEGFAIYAAGYTGNEIGGTNSNKLVGTNASSNATIVSGTATTAGNPDISNWAMKLAITQDSGDTTTNAFAIDSAPNVDLPSEAEQSATQVSFSEYHVVPNEYVKVAHKNSMTDMTAVSGGVKLTTTYAAYISKTQPADTYTGQVIYTLVHPQDETPASPQASTPGKITYHANSSKALGTMGEQDKDDAGDDLADGAVVTLLASNFSRDGYGFAGWSNKYDYTSTTDSDLKFYGPQETIQTPTGTTESGLSLYAVWIPSAGVLQDADKVATLCGTGAGSLTQAPTDGTANLSSVSALTDLRDNQTYAIAKLADGKCWMIENLRLGNTAEHNSDGTLAQGYSSSFIGLADPESNYFYETTMANSLYTNVADVVGKYTISGSNSGQRFPRYNNLNTPASPDDRSIYPTSNNFANNATTPGMYSYGNYYTWAAVVADTTDYHYAYDNQSINSTSICPTGWILPKGGNKNNEENNDFWNLVVNGVNHGTKPANYESSFQPFYNSDPEGINISMALRAYPNNFLYSGYFDRFAAVYRGSYGNYWSSTVERYGLKFYLNLTSTSVRPGTQDDPPRYGFSVRCVAGW